MKGVRSSVLLIAVLAVVSIATYTTQVISNDDSGFQFDTSKGARYVAPTYEGYTIYADFEKYLIEKANELNKTKQEGVPDAILRATSYSSCITKYPDGSRKGVILAKVQVSFDGKAPNIREHKRIMKALGTTGIHYAKLPENTRYATSAMATHVFFADYEDGHWILFPSTRGLLERGVPMDVRFALQREATGLLEGHMKKIGENSGI